MFDPETAVARISYGASVKRVGFRGRLFLILLGFALIPSILTSLAWSATVVRAAVGRRDGGVGQRGGERRAGRDGACATPL